MKRILLFAATIAGLISAASCQQENLEPIAKANKVTYTVQVADAVGTKALGDDVNAVNELVYEVWRTQGTEITAFDAEKDKLLYHRTTTDVNDGVATLELEFVNDQNFIVLFWAQTEGNGVYDATKLTEVKIASPDVANNPNAQAFVGRDFVRDCVSDKGGKVTLTRPVAQLNIGTTYASLDAFNPGGEADVTITGSSVEVTGLSTSYNVATLAAGEASKVAYKYNYDDSCPLPTEPLNVNSTNYKYVAMNYVGFPANDGSNVTVTYVINTSEGDIDNADAPIANVPVKANYRTNIIGNLITSKTDYIVTLDKTWADAEITHANTTEAVQAALDSATDGDIIQLEPGVNYGTLYLRPTAHNNTTMYCEDHNFTTTDVNAFKAHLADGQWHSTPKYTTTIKDLTIKGAEGATVAGFVVTSGHATGSVYDYVLDKQHTVGSAYYNTLHLNNICFSNVAFTGNIDINTSDAESVYDGITFDGCTFTTGGTAEANGAAIRYYNEDNNGKTSNINVNDCTFNNCRQGVYVHHVNGITITDNTFENTGHNAIAIQGHDGAVNLQNVVITGNTFNNIGDRIIRFNNVGAESNITIQNNVATNSGDEDGEVIKATSIASGVVTSVKNNRWGVGKIVANDELKDSELIVATAEELAYLVNNAKSDIIIALTADLEGKISLTQNAGIDVTILGNGHKFTGALHIWGNGAGDDRSMTIKNINFDGTGLTVEEGCIYTTGPAEGKNSYACNVTIEDCTFTGAGVAAIRQNVAGEKDWTIRNCTVASDMHSLLQVSNTNKGNGYGLLVENCEVYSKNGANLNYTCNATFTNCLFDVQGYAVRVGVNDNGNPNDPKLFNFTDCNFTSDNLDGDAVVIVRRTAENATLNFVRTTLNGNPQISGYTSATKINGIDLPQQNWEIWYTATALVHAHFYKDKFGEGTDLVSNVWDETTGKGVITLSGDVTTIGVNAFYGREHLISVSIPNSVTEIGEDAFDGCPNLTTVNFNANLKTIGPGAFGGCAKLTNVVLPDGLTTIADAAFQSCEAMASITIPASVTSIGASAFNLSRRDFKVYCKPTTPPTVGYQPFNKYWAVVYVPTASLAEYQTAWDGLADAIVDGNF